jgi:hypothetical protein
MELLYLLCFFLKQNYFRFRQRYVAEAIAVPQAECYRFVLPLLACSTQIQAEHSLVWPGLAWPNLNVYGGEK